MLLKIPLTEKRSSSIGKVVLFDRVSSFSFRREAPGMVREERTPAWPAGSTVAISGMTDVTATWP